MRSPSNERPDNVTKELPAMYEHHKEPVLPRRQFLRRAARHGAVSEATVREMADGAM